jgi:hypothetical protein
VPAAIEAASVAEALRMAEPRDVKASAGSKTDPGVEAFEGWAVGRLRWSDVSTEPAAGTSYGRVMKDVDAERGKRLCVKGEVVQIEKSTSRGGPVFRGVMQSAAQEPFRYTAVGSTGELVTTQVARLCGVVVGRNSYESIDRATVHAVHLVGMFDLPENRATAKPSSPGGTVIDVNSL